MSIYWNSLHNVNYHSVAEELGAITGPLIIFFLLPFLLNYLVKGIAKHSKSDLGIKDYIVTFFIVWCILVVQGLRGAYLEKNIQNQSNVMNTKFHYKPQGSEYSVVFENKPTISSAITPIGSYVLKGENAEVDMPDYGYLERVEFCLLDKKFLDIFTQDFIYKFLNEYSKINGLIYPQMTFPENKTGNIGELRANKEIIDNKGNKRILTFVAKVYLKGETMFVTFVGADSKNFPTPEIERFGVQFNNSERKSLLNSDLDIPYFGSLLRKINVILTLIT